MSSNSSRLKSDFLKVIKMAEADELKKSKIEWLNKKHDDCIMFKRISGNYKK